MNRSVKNYLNLLLSAASFYFMGVAVLKAHEIYTTQIEEGAAAAHVPLVWYFLAGLLGLLGLASAGWFVLSRRNELSLSEALKERSLQIRMALYAAGGFAGGLLLAVVLVGSLPKLKMPEFDLPDTTAFVKEDKPSETQKEEKKTFPIPDLPPVESVTNLADKATGSQEISDVETLNGSYSSDVPDQSILLMKDGAIAALVNCTFTKTGDSTDNAASLNYGLNAALFVQAGGNMNVLSSNTTTDAYGAPAAVVNGDNATCTMSDGSMATKKDFSPVDMALFGSAMRATNMTLSSVGNESPVFKTARNGVLTAENSTCTTFGLLSPIVEGTGLFNLSSLNCRASNSPLAMLYGGSHTEILGSAFSVSGEIMQDGLGAGILFGPSDETQKDVASVLTMTNCQVNFLANAPEGTAMFVVENSQAQITLRSNTLSIPQGSLLKILNGSAALSLDGQTVSGNISADASSSGSVTLANGSSLSGAVNPENSGASISLHLDGSSKLSLSGDCWLSSFENEDASNANITTNGFHIYVNGQAVL